MRPNVRLRLAKRPIASVFVRGRPIKIPPIYLWVVQHDRFSSWYWRDPYGFRTQFGDPRSDWGPRERAHHFRSEEEARDRLKETGYRGRLIKMTIGEVLP